MAVLTCENLSLGYNGREILHGLNFSVDSGDYLCIVGENGSGKSTLMKTILGLQAPLGGNIIRDEKTIKNGIGYLPQQTAVQKDFPASVLEIVLTGCQNSSMRPFYNREQKQQALKSLEKMGILNLSKCCYRELSGGQQQRVLLARSLSAAKNILLLDEPVSGLDPNTSADMYELINDLNKKDGITVIMISHDIAAALRYADKILHIGESVFFGTKQEYLSSNAYLGYTKDGNIK